MRNDGHEAYLESRVLSADPRELVHMLYHGCVQAVRDARHYLAHGEIAERSRAINKACEILMELNGALDRERGGDLASRLAQLYDYMHRRLMEGNIQQSDAPLAEVLGLLVTLGEAWEGVRPVASYSAVGDAWSQGSAQEAYTAQAWSF